MATRDTAKVKQAVVNDFLRKQPFSRASFNALHKQCFSSWAGSKVTGWLSSRPAVYKRTRGGDATGGEDVIELLAPRQHKKQEAKRRRLQLAWLNVLGGDKLYGPKGHVDVSLLPEQPASAPGAVQTRSLTVCNKGKKPRTLCSFIQARPLPEVRLVEVSQLQGARVGRLVLAPGASCQLDIHIAPTCVSVVRSLLVLNFDGFSIGRMLEAKCELLDIQVPPATAPFQPAQLQLRLPETDIVHGEPPARSKNKWQNPPGQHTVLSHVEARMGDDALLHQYLGRPPTRTVEAHTQHLSKLMFVEEMEHKFNVQRYNMSGSPLKSVNRFLWLEVPGLAEKRPSVMRGDVLFAQRADGASLRNEYEGFVHEVREKEVQLRFHAKFHAQHVDGMLYNIRFVIRRSTFVFMQEAVALAGKGHVCRGMLLPVPREHMAAYQGAVPPPIPAISSWFNMKLDAEQRQAVQYIVAGHHAPAPYLLFGPPGTGKTTTVVEAMLQVIRHFGYMSVRVCLLACAPSNSAADLLAERLLGGGVSKSALRRVCAYQRAPLPAGALKDVSNWDDDVGAFVLPAPGTYTATGIKVVVTTCLMAAKLYALGVPPSHFTHFFIDEAGHAEEPLTLAAIAGLINSSSGARLVLAGDPKQLGPIILSRPARTHGLEISMLERLIDSPPYARGISRDGLSAGAYDPCFITKLVKNFRSHPDILWLPNELFYDGELEACADVMIRNSMLGWEKLPNPRFPMAFVAVNGKDEREGNSPSWFNISEVQLVVKWVGELLAWRTGRLTDADIGVITPYRKQVARIRSLLVGRGCRAKVGSVEEFQGQERKVIIISTVRSSTEWMDFDQKHHLGFVASPKRFNVAITRAKALVIIIGNPAVLQHDTNWSQLLHHIYSNGGCTGVAMPSAFAGPSAGDGGGSDDELAAALEQLSINTARELGPQYAGAADLEVSAMRRIDA